MLAVIGGSGLYSIDELRVGDRQVVETPYGATSGPVVQGSLDGDPILFIARHGEDHAVAPHLVNYRANVSALAAAGAGRILAVSTVGAIDPRIGPGSLVLPDQLIDYTWGREQTFSGVGEVVSHVDFTHPYSPEWRGRLAAAMREEGIDFVDGGTYAAVQGPRFETAAEIRRLADDGCSVVGMTAMPEAALAREIGLAYAAICPVGNLAAGVSPKELSMGEVVNAVKPVLELVPKIIARLAKAPRRGK